MSSKAPRVMRVSGLVASIELVMISSSRQDSSQCEHVLVCIGGGVSVAQPRSVVYSRMALAPVYVPQLLLDAIRLFLENPLAVKPNA